MRWIVFVILLVCANAALAEKRVALVIGNDRYTAMRPLNNAARDADTVGSALEALGFEVFFERNRDLRRMRRALEDLEYDGEGADVALVYFAGHGFELNGDNRLLPVDADPSGLNEMVDSSISLAEIRALVARIAPVGIVLLDACRTDPFVGAKSGRAAAALDGVNTGGFAPMPRAAGTLIGFSTAPGAVALDGAGDNSPFAAALARHLAAPGLEVRSVLTLVQQEVYDRTRGAQLPYVESALPRLFFASGQNDALPERERLLLAMADLTSDLRREVEEVAQDAGVPLAPIYGALLAGGLQDSGPSARTQALRQAAQAFAQTRAQLRGLSASDEAVAALRDQAENRLSLGDFSGAIAFLDEARALDRDSAEALAANLVTRRISEAGTLLLKASMARTRLDFDLAATTLSEALAALDPVADLATGTDLLSVRADILRDAASLLELRGQLTDAESSFAALASTGMDMWDIERSAQSDDAIFHGTFGLARIALQSGAFDDAVSSAEIAVRFIPNGSSDEERRNGFFKIAQVRSLIARASHHQASYASAARLYQAVVDGVTKELETADDTFDYETLLAVALEGRADAEMGLGQHEAAFDSYWEALERVGELRNAGGFRDDVAIGRLASKAGGALLVQGHYDAAEHYYLRAMEFLQVRFAADPERVALRLAFGQARMGLARTRMESGASKDALPEANAAVSILAAGGDQAARDMDVSWALAQAWHLRGEIRFRLGDFATALSELRETDAGMKSLRDRNVTRVAWIADHVRLRLALGRTVQRTRDQEDAWQVLASARDDARLLNVIQKENLDWLQLTYEVHQSIVPLEEGEDAQSRLRRLDTLAHFAVLHRTWHELSPDDGDLKVNAGRAYLQLGHHQLALDRLDDADETWRQAYDYYAAAREAVSDISMLAEGFEVLDNLGGLYLEHGDPSVAVDWLTLALDWRHDWAEVSVDPDNAAWWVSVAQERLGNALGAAGDRDAAIAQHMASKALRESLMARHADNAQLTYGLFVSHFQLADLGLAPRDNFQTALGILEKMDATGSLTESGQAFIPETRARLRGIATARGR